MKKRWMSLILALAAVLSLVPVSALAADDYLCYLTYADIQSYQGSEDLRYGGNSDHIAWQLLPNNTVYLAKNELEGFQIFYYESGAGRNLRVRLSAFTNQRGDVLPAALYREICFTPAEVAAVELADALLPYDGEEVAVQSGKNEMFYVELHSAKDQPAGDYSATLTLYDGDQVLTERSVRAVVWDFALPEGHYSTFVSGLYNAASGYGDTSGFLRANGVRFTDGGEVLPADRDKAEAILEGWQEFLLQHGISTYELPRWLLETDPKEAERRMADPRRKVFTIPLAGNARNELTAGNLNGQGTALIRQYKALVYDNPFLKDKAFFYPLDEPTWQTEEDAASFRQLSASLESLWPEYHAVVPINGGANFSAAVSVLSDTADILCMNHTMIVDPNGAARAQYSGENWDRIWLYYPGNILYGGFDLYRWGKSSIGPFRRVPFWQQDLLGGDGILYWNCAYLPLENGEPRDVWGTRTLARGGAAGVNGDGILVYPGVPVGEAAETPIASLRLKQIAAGMDDYDYLQLAKEFLPAETLDTALKQFLRNYERMDIFNSEGAVYENESSFAFYAWTVGPVNSARITLGNALSAAATEHDWGAWESAVASDRTHPGLELRTCAHCGAQESRDTQDFYPVEDYKGQDASSPYPQKGGKVFAGWFTDETCREAYGEPTGTAYAKFVDEKVLTAKWQIRSGTTAESEQTDLHLITTVDTLDYQEVGFRVRFGEEQWTRMSDTVYQKLNGWDGRTLDTYYPGKDFCPASQWFKTLRINEIPRDRFDTDIEVTPLWTTLDGTQVEGTALRFRLSDDWTEQNHGL